MMGFLMFLSTMLVLVGTVGALIAHYFSENKSAWFLWLLLPIGLYLGYYVYGHEYNHYLKYGNPQISYTQVKALSGTKMTTYEDIQRGNEDVFTVDPDQLRKLKEGDIIKITYVDGIYRAFAIKVEKLVAER
jgi:hypothetical protein